MKRAFDIAVSLLGLLLLSPILAVAMLAIRLESAGSPIFAQQRVGYRGRIFTCYKLRTMRKGTADLPSHQTDASAVTSVGARFRRWKLDEIPQLFNVLIGQMSLVGPRPCLPMQIELIEARRRLGVFEIQPGITGLAQVQNVDMSEPERLATIDAEYLHTRTFMKDLHLIMSTMRGHGVGVDQARGEKPGQRESSALRQPR
jgi:O-antigen biosynthesis protein WbqP